MAQSSRDRSRSLRRSAEHCRALIHDALPSAVVQELESFAHVLETEASKIEEADASDKPRPRSAVRTPRRSVLQGCY